MSLVPLSCALLIGVVAGLRSMMPLAALAWSAKLGLLPVHGTPFAFLNSLAAASVFGLAAIGEIIGDKLPKTPSRTVPPAFAARILSGGVAGAVLGSIGHSLVIGAIAGGIGAVLGTLGGARVRGLLAEYFGKDLPAALIEDAVAVICAMILVTRF